MDDETAQPFQIKAMPADVKSVLRLVAWDERVTMSQLVLDILTGKRPPLPRRQ